MSCPARTPRGLAILALLLLAGCATGYHPKGLLGAGFSERQLRPDVWLVTFDASAFTPRDLVQTYLMLRCAEITVGNNASYFAILSDGEGGRARLTPPTLIDKAPFPLGQSAAEPLPESSRSQRAAIQLLKEKPDEAERLYDARELIRRLAPQTQERRS